MSSTELPPIPRLASRTTSVKRRAPRERTLSREAIAAAALQIVDDEGLEAMTMRRVAQALGTGAASLYAHVASKEELVELVVERAIGEMEIPGEPDPAHWQDQVKEALRAMRAAFAAHRDLARASFARIPLGENALRRMDWMVGLLRAGGLPDQVVAYAADLLPLYAMAVAYEEGLYANERNTPEQMDEYIASMRTYFAALPGERFPNMAALAVPLTTGSGDERFEFGLDVLVGGLAAMAH